MARLLLVEDNEMNQELLARRLRRRGFEVDTASSGRIAVQMSLARIPDLILMDTRLPDLDGPQTTRLILARRETAHVPIIGLSAQPLNDGRESAQASGYVDFLLKPVDFDELLATIRKHLAEQGK
jgi:two-component system cell cycle response regulator DivK